MPDIEVERRASYVTKEYLHKELGKFSASLDEIKESIANLSIGAVKGSHHIDQAIHSYDQTKKSENMKLMSLVFSVMVIMFGALWQSIGTGQQMASLQLELALTKQSNKVNVQIAKNKEMAEAATTNWKDWFGSAGKSDGVKVKDSIQTETIKKMQCSINDKNSRMSKDIEELKSKVGLR